MFFFFSEAAPATPSINLDSLYSGGEVGGYYSFQDLSKLKQNSDGTGAAAVGSPVGYVEDLSGNGNHLVTLTTARRPTLQQDAGGNYYLDLDGVDDEFRCYDGTNANLLQSTQFSFFTAIETSDTHAIYWVGESTADWLVGYQDGNGASGAAGGSATLNTIYINATSQSFTTSDSVHALLSTGGKVASQFNGTTTAGFTSATGWFFSGYPSVRLAGKLYAFGWRADVITDSGDVTLVDNWLKQEAGI